MMCALFLGLNIFLATSVATNLFKRDFPEPAVMSGFVSGNVHDPTVVRRDDGKYFLFTTNDKINIATSMSLEGPWDHQGSALPSGSIIDLPGNDDLWAPDVQKVGDTYYLYYAVSTFGSSNSDIGIATSQTMEIGSWTDHGSVGIPDDSRYNKIDLNLLHDGSQYWMTWGSFWTGIFQTSAENPSKFGGTAQKIAENTTNGIEGAYQYKWNIGGVAYYYLFFSQGACCASPGALAPPGEEYKVMVCRSTSANGPFVDEGGKSCASENGGDLILASHDDVYAPGGQAIFYDADQNSSVMVYHYVRPSIGYAYDQFFWGWNKLDFSSGWPKVV